ncbi:uncharacterized protein LOC117173045 [Belonocnema kinseyi]|uniref:uncharacterized protein LOC117173045 n=1 Tax=Belonocnema kinseyi TaxID=2817044 RepID=UPI00143D40D9|nr:uncharacterized protein LOC117173045 [Belonocnema kinseyi]XP_033217307.1 uncharacterized protein LOC117173045 [Belonocnema kinseyi]
MKDQISPRILEIRNFPTKTKNFQEAKLIKDSNNENGFTADSGKLNNEIEKGEKIQESRGSNKTSNLDEINLNLESSEKQENYLDAKLKKWLSKSEYPENFQSWSKREKKDWLYNNLKMQLPDTPDSLADLMIGIAFDGDCGRSPEERPDWLDMEKFKRGQKFGRDYAFGLAYSQMLSLFVLFSFEDALKPLIITGKSSTPYTAFKRYLSTNTRVRNWNLEDPWKKDTSAYNDIQAVRKMHTNIRKRLEKTKNEDIDEEAKIKNLYCPTRDILLEDFQSACLAPVPGQCPYIVFRNPDFKGTRPKGLHQGEMVATQFGFVGLMILYPKSFGAHYATEEDLEAFCHLWRGLGYLLGMDDDFNLCRGSLNDVRQRCRDILELWAKPNFRELTPECEHMMRCVVEGTNYYLPGSTYESSILYLSELLNLNTPRLYSTLSYGAWIRHKMLKTFFCYTSRLPGMMSLMNSKLDAAFEMALNFSPEKHKELQKKSEESLQRGSSIKFSP